jgi:hypothetical protein
MSACFGARGVEYLNYLTNIQRTNMGQVIQFWKAIDSNPEHHKKFSALENQ